MSSERARLSSDPGVPALRVEGVSKSFDGVFAVRDVHFDLLPGEVHALVGENGAGKSTLIKALAGLQPSDKGRFLVDGKEAAIATPAEARSLGIATIFQDFDLPANLSVVDSLLLGHEEAGPLGLLKFRRRRERAQFWLSRAGLEVLPDAPTGSLSAAQRQLLALAKALSQDAQILIMDEPTSALAPDESGHLLGLVEELRAEGRSVIFVSHKLDEVMRIADRVTVLRDGRVTGTCRAGETSLDELVSLMVGRDLKTLFEYRPRPLQDAVLAVRGLSRRGSFEDIGFDAAGGEVLGFYGLKGAGRSPLMRTLFGLEKPDCGEVRVKGRTVRPRSPSDAIRAGVAMVPEDRKVEALFPNMSVRDNLAVAALDKFSRSGWLDLGAVRAAMARYQASLNIKLVDPGQPIEELSGGNQQKVVLARWLLTGPAVLLLDEPTAGIDIGAKAETYRLVNELAEAGLAVLFASSELPELLGVSDRILVMAEGRLVGEFSRGEATEARIMRAIQAAKPLPAHPSSAGASVSAA